MRRVDDGKENVFNRGDQVVPLAIVTTNCRKSAEGIVAMKAGETQKE